MALLGDTHVEIDWLGDGNFAGADDDVTALIIGAIQARTGVDADTLTGYAGPGLMRFTVDNRDFRFSPFYTASDLSIEPTFVAAGTASTANGVAPTPALPAGLQLGDYMLAAFYSREVTDGDVAISSGWKQLYNERSSGGLLALWGRVYQTGDAAPTFTLGGHAAGDDVIAQIAAFRHVNTARPIGVKGAIASNASAQNIGAITGITLGAKGLLVVLGGKLDDWTSVATLSQTGMTFAEIGEPDATAGNDAGFVWNYGTVDAETELAVTSKTFTVTGGASAAGKGVMLSLNPELLTRPGTLVRLRDDTDVLWIGRLSKIQPSSSPTQAPVAQIEAVGILAEAANVKIPPLVEPDGDDTGTLIAEAIAESGLDTTGIEAGDVVTGPFGTAGTELVSLLSEIRRLEDTERGFLHEDQEEYRLLFHAKSHREALLTSLATFSDASSPPLKYEAVSADDWVGHIFNRAKASVSPWTLGDQAVLATIDGPIELNPGESQALVASYDAAPVASWNGHTRDIWYGATVPALSSAQSPVLTANTSVKTVTLPATVNANDLILIRLLADQALVSGTPAGFTKIVDDTIGGGSYYTYLFAKIADGTEDSLAINFTLAAATTNAAALQYRITSAFRDVAGIEAVKGPALSLGDVNPPSITPSWGALDSLFISEALFTVLNTQLETMPTGYTKAATFGATGSGATDGPAGISAYRQESTGVTSEDPSAFVVGEFHHAQFTIAIKGTGTAPVFQDNRVQGTGTNTTHNFTVNATVNANDLILFVIVFDAAVTVTSGVPAGYTLVADRTITVNGTARRQYIFAKNAAGTEDGATVTITTSAGTSGTQHCYRFSNWGGTVGTHISLTANSSSSRSSSVTPQPITPAWGSAPEAFIVFFDYEVPVGSNYLDLTQPTGYTWTYVATHLLSAYKTSSGVVTETPGDWLPAYTLDGNTWTIAIRGAATISAGVVGATPNTPDGAFSISYDNSLGGGVGYQEHRNIQITGTPLVSGEATVVQADYLPSQDPLKGVGVRTYPLEPALFRNAAEAQDFADETVLRYGERQPVMSMSYRADIDSTHHAAAIARKVGDRITLIAANSMGLGVSEDFFIESISRVIEDTYHEVTYTLSPAALSDP